MKKERSDMQSETDPEPIKRRKIIRIAMVAALVIALLFAISWSWNWWATGRFIVNTNNAYIKAETTIIAPKVAGYVEKVLVKSNERVAPGQTLAIIDPGPYQAALDNALADIAARQADLARTQSEISKQGALIDQSGAQADAERSRMALAETEARRYARLAKLGADSQEKADRTAAARDQASAQSRAAVAAVRTAQRSRDIFQAKLQQNRAALAAARARQRQARIDLDATTLRANQTGLVADKNIVAGQYVQAGTRLMTIVPVEGVYLEANLKETQLEHVRIGQPVTVHLDAYPDAELTGKVESLSPGTGAQFALIPPNNATGNFTKIVQRVPVRIRLSIPADMRELLIPGLSAEVDIDTRSAR